MIFKCHHTKSNIGYVTMFEADCSFENGVSLYKLFLNSNGKYDKVILSEKEELMKDIVTDELDVTYYNANYDVNPEWKGYKKVDSIYIFEKFSIYKNVAIKVCGIWKHYQKLRSINFHTVYIEGLDK